MSVNKNKSAIKEARDQLYVDTADGPFLNNIGNNLGLNRPSIGFGDDNRWRAAIKKLAIQPKLIYKAFRDILEICLGPQFGTRHNLTSSVLVGDKSIVVRNTDRLPQIGSIILDPGLPSEETVDYCFVDYATNEIFLTAPLETGHSAIEDASGILKSVAISGATSLSLLDTSSFPETGYPYPVLVGRGTEYEEVVLVSFNDTAFNVLSCSPLLNSHSGIKSDFVRKPLEVAATPGRTYLQLDVGDTKVFPVSGLLRIDKGEGSEEIVYFDGNDVSSSQLLLPLPLSFSHSVGASVELLVSGALVETAGVYQVGKHWDLYSTSPRILTVVIPSSLNIIRDIDSSWFHDSVQSPASSTLARATISTDKKLELDSVSGFPDEAGVILVDGTQTSFYIFRQEDVSAINPYSLDLEASSAQYLSITDGAQTGLDITDDITIELWAKFESTATNTFVAKWGVGFTRSYWFQYSGGNLSFRFSNNGDTSVQALQAFTPTIGVWYHFAVSRKRSDGVCRFYVNGVQQGVDQVLSAGSTIFNGSSNFEIGREQAGSPNYFDGLIDEVRVWSTVRSLADISDSMLQELPLPQADLRGYWKFANDFKDSTANSNDLTANNSPVFSTDKPFPKPSLTLTQEIGSVYSAGTSVSLVTFPYGDSPALEEGNVRDASGNVIDYRFAGPYLFSPGERSPSDTSSTLTTLVPPPTLVVAGQLSGRTNIEVKDASLLNIGDIIRIGRQSGNSEDATVQDSTNNTVADSLDGSVGIPAPGILSVDIALNDSSAFPETPILNAAGYRVIVDEGGPNEEILTVLDNDGATTLTVLANTVAHNDTETVRLLNDVITVNNGLIFPHLYNELVEPLTYELVLSSVSGFPSPSGTVYLNFGLATPSSRAKITNVVSPTVYEVPDSSIFPPTGSPYQITLGQGKAGEERVYVSVNDTGLNRLTISASPINTHSVGEYIEFNAGEDEVAIYQDIDGTSLVFDPPVLLSGHVVGERVMLSSSESTTRTDGYSFPLVMPPDISACFRELFDLVKGAGILINVINSR